MSAPPQQETWTAQPNEPRPPRADRTRDSAAPESTRPEAETNNGAKPGGAGTANANRPATEAGQRKQTQQQPERKPQPAETKEQPRTNNRARTRSNVTAGTPDKTKAPPTDTERRKRRPNQRESTTKSPQKEKQRHLLKRGLPRRHRARRAK